MAYRGAKMPAQIPNNRKRPSIELAPTMPQPIHIISRNLNGPHLLLLIEVLEQNGIPYQMQQETDTLGYALDRHFFVLVDNRMGQVKLGKEFGSKMITVVGYPKVGRSKATKYCKTPQEVVQAYRQAKNTPPNALDCIMEEMSAEKSTVKPKITVKSVIKHAKPVQQTPEMGSMNSLKRIALKEYERRQLGIWWDEMDLQYNKLCVELFLESGGQDMIKIEGKEQMIKNVSDQQDRVSYFYLVNRANSHQVLQMVTKGQVIIYESRAEIVTMTHLLAEPKIFGVACEGEELNKILTNIGFKIKHDPNQPKKESEVQPEIRVSKPPPSREEIRQETIKQEVIKQQTVSIVKEPMQSQESAVSQGRKIKKLKGGKSAVKQNKETIPQVQPQLVSQVEITSSTGRKRTLKTNQVGPVSRSKKNISFKPDLVDKSKDKKRVLKSLSKTKPEVVERKPAKEESTMTEDYYNTQGSKQNDFVKNGRNSFTFSGNLSGTLTGFFAGSAGSFNKAQNPNPQGLNAIMYKDFVPQFKQIVQTVKTDPEIFALSSVPATYGFMTLKEYDRFVRRVKNRLREKDSKVSEFNFITLVPQSDLFEFLEYCRAKNRLYDEEEHDLANTGQVSQFSSISAYTTRINVFLFVQGSQQVRTIDCGRINIFQRPLPNSPQKKSALLQMRDQMLEVGSWNRSSVRA